MKNQWEDIGNESMRLKVPGGWIVKGNYFIGNEIGPGVGAGTSMIFISDVGWSWEL